MKKIFAMILTIAMLMTAVAAFAEDKDGPMGGPQPGQTQQGPQGGRGEQPPEKPADGQQPPEKPDAAPEKPTGEKPADAPEEPEDLTGDVPEQPSDDQAQQPPEKPADGQAPADGQQPPEKPADGQQPSKTDDKMIDFDAMVTGGVISQETCDAIKTYMDAHKPEGAPADGQSPAEGQQPTEGQQPPEKPADDQQPDLLGDLLSAGVITQAEYEALTAAQTAA